MERLVTSLPDSRKKREATMGPLLLLACGAALISTATGFGLNLVVNPLNTLGSDAVNSLNALSPVALPDDLATGLWDETFGQLSNKTSSQIGQNFLQLATPGVRHRIVTDVQFGGHKLAELFQDQEGNVLECNLLGDRNLINGALKFVPGDLITSVTEEEMFHYVDLCYNRPEKAGLLSIFSLVSDLFKSLFIFPGTKWCGAGDVARNYDDLGVAAGTDSCCRAHDHAHDNIPAFGEKHGLRNTNFYTMTHCTDDRQFHTCLKGDNSATSVTVGTMYFDILRTWCFDFTYPKTCTGGTSLLNSLLLKTCTDYRLDTSAPMEWGSFPPFPFTAGGQDGATGGLLGNLMILK
ncbi:uncharacterized protein LOC135383861 [Ornithodoros turicata]|uniref:uncharacterized protein LOC135383861 n=1 Tax=Ornithodoros turicata TaxID=34597 RepID=UPI0031399061